MAFRLSCTTPRLPASLHRRGFCEKKQRPPSPESLRCAVGSEQVRLYRELGYLPPFPFLNAGDIDTCLKACVQMSRDQFLPGMSCHLDGRPYIIPSPHLHSPVFDGLSRRKDTLETVSQMLGAQNTIPLCLVGSRIHIKYPQNTLKEAKGFEFPWHTDFSFLSRTVEHPQRSVLFFVHLTENSLENGALKIISGSHRISWENKKITYDEKGRATYPVWQPEEVEPYLQKEGICVMEGSPGSAFFIHPNLLHSSDVNRSSDCHAQRVLAIFIYYAPDLSRGHTSQRLPILTPL